MVLLAQPLQLKHHTLRNRIIMGSIHTGFEEHPQGAEHLAAFYAERAKGGVALIITGGISPNAEGCVVEDGAKLTNSDEVLWHQEVTDAVHQHGAKICMQVLHTGRYSVSRQPVAPSAIQAPINPAKPRALSLDEVKQTVQDYIQCALLAKEAGYDGVEVMGSEGYLINQFIAPATNVRTDEYGGSLENRHRFAVEVVNGIRQACGDDFLIIYRISLLDLVANGSTWEENQILAEKITNAGADMFNTGIGWHEARIPTIATSVPRAAFAQFTAKLTQISSIPVIATNRINMPDVAEAILESHEADAVCLARPFLADADWANKAIKQEDNAINTCIACNQACLDHIFAGKLATCLVNPFACHEKQLIQTPASTIKNIAVIGSGPAGMAFAKVAAERGHHVTLFERQPEIGGQLNIAKGIAGKHEFNETLRYFKHVLGELPITQVLNHDVSANDLKDFDEIVLATGIVPRTIDIEGIDHPKVMSYLDVLRDQKAVGNSVAIIGAGGIGFDTAEFLSEQDNLHEVTPAEFQHDWNIDSSLTHRGALLDTQPNLPASIREIFLLQRKDGVVGRKLGKTTGWAHRLSLKSKGVNMMGGVTYQKIDHDGLHIERDGKTQVLNVDNVVICAGQESNRALLASCENLGKPVHMIGGVQVAAELDAKRAILSGTKLALEI